MKLLFSSSDKSAVERVGKRLSAAGIPCEVREGLFEQDSAELSYPELWVRNEDDFRTACIIFTGSAGLRA